MEQSCSWKPSGPPASRNIHPFIKKENIHYAATKALILSHIDPAHTSPYAFNLPKRW
jgi:flagellar motor switch protein FliG